MLGLTPSDSTDYSVTYVGATNGFVVSMTLSPSSVPNATWETPYAPVTFSTGGNNGSVAYSYTGTLPQGLTLSSAGVLTGTPTSKAQIGSTFPFSVTATDSAGNAVTQNYSIKILSPCAAGLTPYFLSATSRHGELHRDLLREHFRHGHLHPERRGPRHGHRDVIVGSHPHHRLRHQPGSAGAEDPDVEHVHRDRTVSHEGGDVHTVVGAPDRSSYGCQGSIELDRIDSRRTNHEPLEDEGRLLLSHASMRFPSDGSRAADRQIGRKPVQWTTGIAGARSAARRSKRGEGT